jgi:hypothetical protein
MVLFHDGLSASVCSRLQSPAEGMPLDSSSTHEPPAAAMGDIVARSVFYELRLFLVQKPCRHYVNRHRYREASRSSPSGTLSAPASGRQLDFRTVNVTGHAYAGAVRSSLFGEVRRGDVTVLDIQDDRLARIRPARRLTQQHDLGVKTIRGQFQKADGAEAQLLVLRKGRAAAIEEYDPLTVLQPFLMGIACYHNIHRRGEELLQLSHGPEPAAQAVDHAEAPAMYLHHVQIMAARIHDGVVIAGGADYGGEAFEPIQDHWGGQIAAVEDEVYGGEKPGRLRSQLVKLTNQVREMSV